MTSYGVEAKVVDDLRNTFDRSFARPREFKTENRENFLAVRVADHPYLIRLSDVVSLHAHRQIVALPSALPELLGIAGFRGVVAAVYDLRVLLGHSGNSALSWLLLVRASEPLGFAFDSFERHISVPSEAVAKSAQAESVRLDNEEVRPVIHVASVVEALERRIVALPRES